MKSGIRSTIITFGLLLTNIAFAQVTTYTYTGNSFLYIGGCCGVSGVSGSFTLASALGANTFYDLSGITNYNFTDGRVIWTSSNTPTVPSPPFNRLNEFDVTTGADGNIASWQINIVDNNPDAILTTQSLSYAGTGGVLDATNVQNNYVAYSIAPGNPNGQLGRSGTWTVTPAPIPEPETYALMLAGLGLLGVVALRRKQNEAA